MLLTKWWSRRHVRSLYSLEYAVIGGVATVLAILLILACAVLVALGGAL